MMQSILSAAVTGLTGRPVDLPAFTQVRVDDPAAYAALSALHTALARGADALESEVRFAQIGITSLSLIW